MSETVILADERTQRKVAELAAYGMDNATIAAALLLRLETVEQIRATELFAKVYSERLTERANRAIDIEDGWDAVEERAIARTLQALEYNVDQRFALQAAAIANRAQRRTPQPNKTIDATRASGMIILSMSKTFVEGKQRTETSAVLAIEQRQPGTELKRKRSDLPTPQKVSALLQIRKPEEIADAMDEMEELAARHGIDVSLLED